MIDAPLFNDECHRVLCPLESFFIFIFFALLLLPSNLLSRPRLPAPHHII